MYEEFRTGARQRKKQPVKGLRHWLDLLKKWDFPLHSVI